MNRKNILGLAGLGLAGMISTYALDARAGSTYLGWGPNGPYETNIPNGRDTLLLDEDPAIRFPQKQKIGDFVARLLIEGKSCNLAYARLFEVSKKDENGEPIKENGKDVIVDYQMVVRGYAKNNGRNWPIFGINLDNICRPLLRQDRLLWDIIRTGDYIALENNTGDIIPIPDLKTKVANTLLEVFGEYGLNNRTTCRDYKRFMHQLGPESH